MLCYENKNKKNSKLNENYNVEYKINRETLI